MSGNTIVPVRSAIATAIAAICVAAIACGLFTAKSEAAAPVSSFETKVLSTQAGGHGDLLVAFDFRPDLRPALPCNCNVPKDVIINSPPGVLGLAANLPRCTLAEFSLSECPEESQVGVAYVEVGGANAGGGGFGASQAIFNMVPRDDQAALLAIELPVSSVVQPIYTSFTVRTESDFGLESKTFGLIRTAGLALFKVHYLFWGVPGDPSHDALRMPFAGFGDAIGIGSGGDYFGSKRGIACLGVGNVGASRDTTAQLLQGINPLREPDGICADQGVAGVQPAVTPYNGTVQPFLTNPTNCSGPLQSDLEVLAYDLETSHTQAPFPAITGCDQLSFDPSLTAKPTTTWADSPSGLDAVLNVPEPSSPSAPSPSQIRATTITLPEGFAIDSNAADGKLACTDEQARFGTRDQAQCPEHAKIGTLEIHSSALPGVLLGALYLGEPLPGDRYRVFFTADGFSLHIKQAGRATLDPVTGQVTVKFDNLPQAPFQQFTFHVFGGERGLLTTPTQCGTYPVKTLFVPWDNELPNQTSTQFFTIDSGPNGTPCPAKARPFNPSFTAGLTDNTGGHHSTFIVDLTRSDGDQLLAGVDLQTPPGFSAILKGIPYCPEAAIARLSSSLYAGLAELASPSCPAASQIGTVVGGAGAGSKPLHIGGKVYWAGPYKGAPLSLVVAIPAVSGPYDLGNVAVRVALYVDPLTARVSAVSDPLPQILEGIPLRVRRVRVSLDRPGFVLNPTNCDSFSVDATATGDQGASAALSTHFQVANCADLPYRPRLDLRLTGGLERRGHPAIHAVFSAGRGEANSRRISVTLPKGELLDNAHIGTVCTRVDFARKSCPNSARVGRALVTTPLLDHPLSGSVYLRSSTHELPDLALDLGGQFEIEAAGRVDSVNERFRATFEAIPDVPVSRITVDLLGGAKGLLQNSESLCAGKARRATIRLSGQNGESLVRHTRLQTACRKSKKKRQGRAG